MNLALKKCIWLLFALIVLMCAPSIAADYYVNADTGSDSNDGSSGSPWATLSWAATQSASVGDIINVADGHYYDDGSSYIDTNGRYFKASGTTATIEQSASWGDTLVYVNGGTLEGFRIIADSGWNVAAIDVAANSSARNCTMLANDCIMAKCVELQGNSTTITGNSFVNSYTAGGGTWGIYALSGTTGHSITSNTITVLTGSDDEKIGIYLYNGNNNSTISNNTIKSAYCCIKGNNGSSLTIDSNICTIEVTSAIAEMSSIYLVSCTSATVKNNNCKGPGDDETKRYGIWINASSGTEITTNEVYGFYGGLYFVGSGSETWTARNNTITKFAVEQASGYGVVLNIAASTVDLINNIIMSNSSGTNGTGIAVFDGTLNSSYNTIYAGTEYTGTVSGKTSDQTDTNPKFTGFSTDVYTLTPTSSCIRTGSPEGSNPDRGANQSSWDLDVTVPDGGESWNAGSTQAVTWDTNLSPAGNVTILYSTDEGTTYTTIEASTFNDGSYDWTVPSVSTTSARVKIETTSNTLTTESASNFTITVVSAPPTIEVTSPNGGENIEGGSAFTITWTIVGSGAGLSGNCIDISLTTAEAGYAWPIASVASSPASYIWTVPTTLDSTTCKITVEVTDTSSQTGTDESNSNFTIDSVAPSAPTLEAPADKSSTDEATVTFSWTASIDTGSGVASYEITIDNVLVTQDATTSYTTPSAMSYTVHTWEVRAKDAAGKWGNSSGTSTFEITLPGYPVITVDSPNGGENIEGGSAFTVTWTIVGSGAGLSGNCIDISLTTAEAGYAWPIASVASSPASYIWTVPTTLDSTTCKITVEATDTSSQTGTDESNSNFTIDTVAPSAPTLEAPADGSTTSEATVTFTWQAAVDPSPASGVASYEITVDNVLATQDATTSYTTPSALSIGIHTWEVRAKDAAGNWGTSEGAATFEVIPPPPPTIEATSPNGGENIQGGSTFEVTWTIVGDGAGLTGNCIDISLTTAEAGYAWPIASVASSPASYIWTVPTTLDSTTCKITVEVTDTSSQTGTDESNSNFTIDSVAPGEPTLEAPADKSSTDEATVTFTWQAAIDPSPASGVASYEITVDNVLVTQDATTSYTTPSALSIGIHTWEVRAKDAAGNWGTSEGAATFEVTYATPAISITYPNGGEYLKGASTVEVTWTVTSTGAGLSGNCIKLSLITAEAGYAWPIHTATSGATSFNVTVPTNLDSTTCKITIEVTDTQAATATDESDANFTIDSVGPTAPTLEAPANDSQTTDTTPTFSWTAAIDSYSGVASYEITIDDVLVTQGATTSYATPSAMSFGIHTWEVRAKDNAGNWGSSSGTSTFEVIPGAPGVTLLYPNGGESIQSGSTVEVTWTITATGSGISTINLYYTTLEGTSWTLIGSPLTTVESYSWTTSNTVNSSTCKVSIEATDSDSRVARDKSDSNFTLVPPNISITAIQATNPTTGRQSYTNQREISIEVVYTGTGKPALMRIAENSAFSSNDSGWITFVNPANYNVSTAEGTKTIYYKLSSNEVESNVATAEMTYRTTGPTTSDVTVKIGDNDLASGDYIPAEIKIETCLVPPGTASVLIKKGAYKTFAQAAASEVIASSIRIYIDDTVITNGTAGGGYYDSYSDSTTLLVYQVKSGLAAGTHSLQITFKDIYGNEAQIKKTGLLVADAAAAAFAVTDIVNFPNPFNGSTAFGYELTQNAEVTIMIFDVRGNQVKRLFGPSGGAGGSIGYNKLLVWDGKDDSGRQLANGVYLYILKARSDSGKTIMHKGKAAQLR